MLYRLARPMIHALDAERAHRATIAMLKAMPRLPLPTFDGRLAQDVAGLRFASPVGLAAGFDKDAEVPDAMLGLGFGFVEVGTITPEPQVGNPRPRLFRLKEDRAVINRMGFNNGGQVEALARLERRRRRGVVGVVEYERGRLVDRRRASAGGGIGLRTGMHGKGRKSRKTIVHSFQSCLVFEWRGMLMAAAFLIVKASGRSS